MIDFNELSGRILEEAIQIHRDLGPGLLESVYEELLAYRLRKRGLRIQRQVLIPIIYEGQKMEAGFRADLIVEGQIIIEIKSVDLLAPVHAKQVLTYLRLTNLTLGLLINFNEEVLKKGIKRLVNNFDSASSAPLRDP